MAGSARREGSLKIVDLFKALGVAIGTLVITVAASFPMVAFYAYFVEPVTRRSFTMRPQSG